MFKSLVSIFDYDLVIWDPAQTAVTYQSPYQQFYRGRPSPSEDESVALAEDVRRRAREFRDFLDLGRSLVVFASPPQIFYVDTGRKETSGTGRNQKVTRLVEGLDLLSALPFECEATPGAGVELELASSRASNLWRTTRDGWSYRCTLDVYPGEPILRVQGAEKVVGSLEFLESGAVIAVLPKPWIPPTDEDDNDNDIGGRSGDESDQADASNQEDDKNGIENDDRYAIPKAVHAWIQEIATADDEPPPAWTARFLLASEVKRVPEITAVEEEMARLVERLDALKADHAGDQQWKRLVSAQGEVLERQVQSAFETLGFRVLERQRGRGDLRLEYHGKRAVVEVKGLAKSAAEKHAAQLEKWVAEELADEVEAKGILVINGYREDPPDDRARVFPAQMLPYAVARGHCLVTGLQLLAMRIAAETDPGRRDDLARVLMETVGVVNGFSDPREVFQAPADPVAPA